MRKMNILIVVGVAAVVVLGAGWFACGGWRSIATRYDDDSSSDAAIGEIRVTGGTIAVEVRPGTVSGVQIHRVARYLNPLHGRPGTTWRIAGNVLELHGDDSTPFSLVEYVVMVPAGVRVTADIGTGSLDLTGISSADLKVGTGAVKIADGTGSVTTRVGTGEIRATNLRADTVVATTGTGSIFLDLATPADVDAEASTGSLDLTVASAAYRVEASVGSLGKADVRVPNDPTASHRLSLRTGTGSLTLAPR